MSTIVVGRVSLANGAVAPVQWDDSGEFSSFDEENRRVFTKYSCIAKGGVVIVEFLYDRPYEVGSTFEEARHIINNAVLTIVGEKGIGLFPTIEYCKTADNQIVSASPVRIDEQSPFDSDAFRQYLGSTPDLRNALADYNSGLLHPYDSPLFFYRAIETLAHAVRSTVNKKESSEKLTSSDWDIFHRKLGTKSSDLNLLLEFSKKHRHGHRELFSDDEHTSMMKTTRSFIVAGIQFLIREGPQPIDVYRQQREEAEGGMAVQ